MVADVAAKEEEDGGGGGDLSVPKVGKDEAVLKSLAVRVAEIVFGGEYELVVTPEKG